MAAEANNKEQGQDDDKPKLDVKKKNMRRSFKKYDSPLLRPKVKNHIPGEKPRTINLKNLTTDKQIEEETSYEHEHTPMA